MQALKQNLPGIILCVLIAIPAYILGRMCPVAGGPVIAILLGMVIALFWRTHGLFSSGIKFTSKKVLQYAVILLGFGLNLEIVVKTGVSSLPVIISTIAASLITTVILCKALHIPTKLGTLIGVGSSICGGSAIAAAAPVIKASDEEIGQAISTVFFFNVLAALIFPWFGDYIGFAHDAHAFGVFAGTAVNDTSSVTAAASTWDGMWGLGAKTLDEAVTVKLTRTLAIIPICLGLSFIFIGREQKGERLTGSKMIKMVPSFIIMFVLASLFTTICVSLFNVDVAVFKPFKSLSVFMIVMAMAAIGLNCDLIKLIKTGAKPIFLGLCCALAITSVCLFVMKMCGIW